MEIVVSSSDSYITTKNPVIYHNHSPKNCNSTLVENFGLGITPYSSVDSAENLTNTATENIITVPDDAEEDPKIALKKLRSKNVEGLIFGHLNVNSIRNKFEALKLFIEDQLDIIAISETKLDDSFPVKQFCIHGYNIPFRVDKSDNSGGILLYVRSDIPCREIASNLPKNVEGIFMEINIRNKKWLVFTGYNPKTEYIHTFLEQVSKSLNELIKKFEYIVILGDFNAQITNIPMKDFCETYGMKHLITEPTCFKNAQNPTCIDLIMTNSPKSFQRSLCIETGISDYHKLTVTMLKGHYRKLAPIKIKYRNYKKFNLRVFQEGLKRELENSGTANKDYEEFKRIFMDILNKHAPKKEKLIRGNTAPFMNKTLSKSFMQRAKLKRKFNKNPTEENHQIYKKQRNYCSNLLKKVKKEYYNSLDINIFKDNRTFWTNVRPLFSDKMKGRYNEIILIENDQVISETNLVADKLNNYFLDVIESLGIESHSSILNTEPKENDIINLNQLDKIISRYKNHPSILKIKENVKIQEKCSFSKPTVESVEKTLLSLDTKKATIENDIPIKVLVGTKDLTMGYITGIYHHSIENQKFPVSLKKADVIPSHKQFEKTDKANYRPVSLLPSISKIYERDMFTQISIYIEEHLSPYLFGFRKGHSVEQCLMTMLEAWKRALDRKKCVAAVLTDLSKAFDCLNHKFIIAKLDAYGFQHDALLFIYDYLTNRTQRTKVKSAFSSEREIKYGVPQGSILGPLVFNIYLNDIFFFVENTKIANWADDNTPYAIEDSTEKLLEVLEKDTNILIKWFEINEMKSNRDKSHLLIVNGQEEKIT